MIKWEKTKCRGIQFYSHDSNKHNQQYDKFFRGRFIYKGKEYVSSFGWLSEEMTAEDAFVKLKKYKDNAKNGKTPVTYKEEQNIREAEEKAKKKRLEQEKKAAKERLEQEKKDNLTVDEYFNIFYYPDIQERKTSRMVKSEEQHYRLHIKSVIGKKPLKDIIELDGERIKKKMQRSGKAPRTIEYCLTTLKQLLNSAIKKGYIEKNPVKDIKKTKYDNKRLRFLSHDEATQLLNTIKTVSIQTYEMSVVALHCGLRNNEIFSLRGENIDMAHGLINLLDTKTTSSRSLSMTKDVEAIFKNKELKKNKLIFPNGKGDKINIISNSFKRCVEKIGFNKDITDRRKKVTFYTLRHTFASWMIGNGLSLYEVSKLLGHSDIKMTMRYAHLSPNATKKASNLMDKILNQNDNIIELDKARNA